MSHPGASGPEVWLSQGVPRWYNKFVKLRLCGRLPVVLGAGFSLAAAAQTLTITNGIHTYTALTNLTVTMTGRSELWVTATNSPLSGCVIHLNSADAWLFLPGIKPSLVASTYLGQIRVSGAAAVSGSNVRIVEHAMGAVVIPHPPSYQPLQVFSGTNFTGSSASLSQYTAYSDASLPLNDAIRSFRLKRGYTATFAQNGDGTGLSRNFVAQEGDLDVTIMPSGLDNSVSFVRIFPWRWTAKKGICGNIPANLNVRWYYNWNISQNSTLDWEYVPIRQNRWWPGLGQNWQTRGATHLLGYNEPDSASQANITVGDAIWSWPDLLATGLRVGSPATTDGGWSSWLYPFISQADAAGLRVDFVAVHYYRCYDPSNPSGAANQMYNALKGIYDQVKRPLWITEWNNGANWTGCADPTYTQQQACINAMMDMLENAPFVERYALYNWVEDVRRLQWDDGSLTAAGVTYRDKPSRIGYLQEGLPGGGRPAAWLQFEGSVLDGFGLGNNGIAVGIPAYTSGRFGEAIQLDGTNSYVQLPVNTANSAAFSFGAWVNWDGGGDWQRIFDFGNDTSQYLFLTPRSGGGTLRFGIKNGGTQHLLEAAPLPPGQWRHVAVSLSNNVARLYTNGVLAASSTTFSILPSQFNPKRNYLGKSQWPADPLFRGRLDEVVFTHFAMSAAEIAALQTNQPPAANVGDGTWISDASGLWSDTARWTGGLVANGAGYTADFSTLNITASRSVVLNSSRTIRRLKFGDTSGAQTWTLLPTGGSVLTLDSGSGASPSIVVNQNTATISAPLAGVNGLVKSGAGTLVLNGSNSLLGTLYVDTASTTAYEGIVRLAAANAAGGLASISIRNNNSGSSTLQLDGSSGSVTAPAVSLSGRNTNVVAIHHVAGSNSLGGLTLNVGGSFYVLQSDVGTLNLGGVVTSAATGARTLRLQGNGHFHVSGSIQNGGATLGLVKDGPGTLTLAGANPYTGPTTVSNGMLVVHGSLGPGSLTIAGGVLAGNGTLAGPVSILAAGALSPGTSVGTLTINHSLALAGTTFMELNKAEGTNDLVRGLTTVSYGGTLSLTNLGGQLAPGDAFKLFSASNYNGTFEQIFPPTPGPGLAWDVSTLPSDGTLRILRTINTAPTNIECAAADGKLTLSWPADHLGWRLQVQTNTLAQGLGTNWSEVPGSTATNQMALPLSPGPGSVFYRLIFP